MVTTPHKSSDVMTDLEGLKHLTGGRESPLHPHHHRRIILAHILPGYIMKPRRRYRYGLFAGITGMNTLNYKAMIVP
jgi:hypothetical protein